MGRTLLFLLVSTFLFSCGDFNQVLKSKNPTYKFQRAVGYYQKQDYPRALQLLEDLRETYKGRDSMEIIYFYSAYANYGIKDYDIAALYFKDYVENFTTSPRLQECAYMAVYCEFLSIGTYELDQSSTIKTIGALQSFINHYPFSPFAEKCNGHIDVLRKKLQTKQYQIVMQYYNMGDFRAAVVSAKNTLRSFPDLEQKEELEFLCIQAQYLFAKNSVEKKRLLRYQEAIDYWKEYTYINHASGKYAKDAAELKAKIDQEIKLIKETT
jgi:outer membrane protein assembly factor BamD